ncbi:AcrR family transcriptional regulator [Actinoplanes lutulentus]|uniref:TetR family transcriptional regulator n=1 Tax=Actinoplanes lutulentus TaxID=1287878 RepID=A0A327Z0N3_9ACTN|nr:TetR/AcrR family transcriptional regulator [Actinoplanes lutulentus]MBB2947686.1 AcrR family transcriptional regulator [Actinoplanes lutulentus]RAK27742.1 TetR family transcriptional regulator [Actinoplanes lutulentus]
MTADLDFQRARSPEQREARRRAILGVAAELLAEMPLSEISLRELARRVGLSKTNVVRYFETREAVFFALLNQEIDDWLTVLPAELPTGSPLPFADALAASLARRPLLCELWSALGTELERNISADTVRDFKITHSALQARLADLFSVRVKQLSNENARELVSLMILLVCGLWPFANPAPAVAEAVSDPRLAHSRVDFPERLGRALRVTVTGLLALSPA